jgi:hypothetical protein
LATGFHVDVSAWERRPIPKNNPAEAGLLEALDPDLTSHSAVEGRRGDAMAKAFALARMMIAQKNNPAGERGC